MKKSQIGYFLMLLSTISSTALPLITDYTFRLYPNLSAENAVIWGTWGAFLILSPVFIIKSKKRKILKEYLKKTFPLIFFVSAITSLSAFVWWYTISESNSGITELLGRSETIIAFLLGITFLKEKTNYKEIIIIFLSILGLILISTLNGEINFTLAII